MLPNGLLVTLELALGPAPHDRHAALALGMLREDVWLLGPVALPSPSLGHIYPRARRHCARLYDRAVAAAREGRLAGDFALGRALHVLIDMACPAHARAVPHYLHDPFERWVEVHATELAALPLPELPPDDAPGALVDSLAGAARAADGAISAQARRLVPLAAAHVRALLTRHARETA